MSIVCAAGRRLLIGAVLLREVINMLYFIVNKSSRTGKSARIWKDVLSLLQEKKKDYRAFVTEYEGHAKVLAETITGSADDDICLIVVGGDGTVNEVLNGIKDFGNVRFGVIPTGSGNDFARGLGMKGTTEEILNRILSRAEEGKEAYEPIDIGKVSYNGCDKPRLFSISAGVGLDAIVCKKALHSRLKQILNKIGLGKLTYLILTVQTLFRMKTVDVSARYDGKGTKNQKQMIFLAAMNFRAEGGGVPMAPHANAQDGKLSVCAAYGIPKWRTFLYLPVLVAAKHENLRGFSVTDCRVCTLRLKEPMVLHADGEYCAEVTEVTFSCLPGRLRILK